ncbi:MAG: lysophospholipid acyltransferase family protein, partial [Verrucomicrobiales bacterium]
MKPLYWLAHSLAKFSAKVFYNYEVIHPERLIEHGPCLIASNHESFLDPPYVSIAFKRSIYFLARKTLFDNPLFGGAIRRLNAVPVDQDRPDMSSLKRIIKILRSGERVLIFPEGERTLTGNFGPAERGVGLVIAKSQAPVLPVRIFGAYEAFPRGATVPKLGKITVVVGEPLDFSKETPTGDKKEFYQS